MNTHKINQIKKYKHYKSLLKNNTKSLLLINELEDMSLGHSHFDYSIVVKKCEELISVICNLAEDLNAMSDGKYIDLISATEKIGFSIIHQLVRKKKHIRKNIFGLWLADITSEYFELTGAKAANLAEISNQVCLPVPKGFVITSRACRMFFNQAGVYKQIKKHLKDLDVNDIRALDQACSTIKALIMDSALPPEVEKTIAAKTEDLAEIFGGNLCMAVRSSASGEDSLSSSFAGLYDSVLNVRPANMVRAYKEVLAGMFNPRAVFYRRTMGYRDIDDLMSVLCITMVDARSSGCMYTIDPNYDIEDCICINANWGLGVSVVDGSVQTDHWRIARDSRKILTEQIATKKTMLVSSAGYSLQNTPVLPEKMDRPCLDKDEIKQLVDYGLRLEKYFGFPLDVEWAVDQQGKIYILQARPLQRLDNELLPEEHHEPASIPESKVILRQGMTGSSGTASGKAYVLGPDDDLADIPSGAILIAPQTSPLYVPAMSRISGIITDAGSVTGHMASVAREFRIPALVGTDTGTKLIRNKEVITLDASRRVVYKGQIDSIIKEKKQVNLMKNSPVYKLVREVLKTVIPLRLYNPKSPDFSPAGCETLHDVVRFAHEKAMHEMSSQNEHLHPYPVHWMSGSTGLPLLSVQVLNLDQGIREPASHEHLAMEDILSAPFRALLEGMAPVEAYRPDKPEQGTGKTKSSFWQSVFNNLDNNCEPVLPCFASISNDYMHFRLYAGCFKVKVDSICSKQVNSNYIAFLLQPDNSDAAGSPWLRALITDLRKLGFKIEYIQDAISAQIRKYDQDRIRDRLVHVGESIKRSLHLANGLTDAEDLVWF